MVLFLCGCPIPVSLSSCELLLHYLSKMSFQIWFWGGGGQNSETFIVQFSCHFSQFGTFFIFSISTQIFLVPNEGKNSKNLLVNVSAISGNLEHFSFFPFVASFFWNCTILCLVFLPIWGIQNTFPFFYYKNSNKFFIQFYHQFRQFGTLFIFPFLAKCFGPPLWGWGSRMGRGVK